MCLSHISCAVNANELDKTLSFVQLATENFNLSERRLYRYVAYSTWHCLSIPHIFCPLVAFMPKGMAR